MMQLILNAAAFKCHDAIPLVVVDCDNNGVVSHGNEPLRPFPTTSHRQIFFAFSKTSFPLSYSMYNTHTCSHMPMTQRDDEIVL
jgi:hypothetical protein